MKTFSGANFWFGWWCWSCVFWWVFAHVFAFFWRFAPESVWKNSLDVRSGVFWVRSLFLWFFRGRRFFAVFLKDTDQVATGHPHTRLFVCSFSLFVSRRAFCFALFGHASCFLAFFSGCHSGARAFLGFSWNLRGLSSLAPSEAPFLGTRGGKGFPVLLLPCFSFSPSVLLRLHFV